MNNNKIIKGKLNLKSNNNKIIIMNKLLYHKRYLNNKNLIKENKNQTKAEILILKSKKIIIK